MEIAVAVAVGAVLAITAVIISLNIKKETSYNEVFRWEDDSYFYDELYHNNIWPFDNEVEIDISHLSKGSNIDLQVSGDIILISAQNEPFHFIHLCAALPVRILSHRGICPSPS